MMQRTWHRWVRGWGALADSVCRLLTLAATIPIATFGLVGVPLIPLAGVGLPLVVAALGGAWLWSRYERWRISALYNVHIDYDAGDAAGTSWWRRIWQGHLWRAWSHALLSMITAAVFGALTFTWVALGVGLMLVPVVSTIFSTQIEHASLVTLPNQWWPVAGLALVLTAPLVAWALLRVDIALAQGLLTHRPARSVEALEKRVAVLHESRSAAVDSSEAERRRIERDLHDGPQQRLVAIGLDVAMTRDAIAEKDPDVAQRLDHIHQATKSAIDEMRQVARGIAPPILADRGLTPALSALAARSHVPVTISCDDPQRYPANVEAIAYYCVSESLTNVTKHAAAQSALVTVSHETSAAGSVLVVQVRDDGHGGADASKGTGINGLGQRVRSIDGSLTVTSPPGGPTTVRIELPLPNQEDAR